jgi:DNA-binding NtrC family response regulator
MSHFLGRATPARSLDEIPDHIMTMFRAHRWPGNVRELQNAVQRLILMPERPLDRSAQRAMPPESDHEIVDHDSEVAAPLQPLRIARREASDAFERGYLRRLLARTGGNIRRGAAIAEVSRQMIQRLMRRHGM